MTPTRRTPHQRALAQGLCHINPQLILPGQHLVETRVWFEAVAEIATPSPRILSPVRGIGFAIFDVRFGLTRQKKRPYLGLMFLQIDNSPDVKKS